MDVVEEYKSIEISEAVLLQLLPKMMPRYYTIASSSKLSPTKVRIAISLEEHQTGKGKDFIGLTSDYLKRIYVDSFKNDSGADVSSRIFIKESLFKYPEDPSTPIVCVGPGTGVVPFIAFSEERQYIKAQNPEVELGDAILYFGCKERAEDYIYLDEITQFKEEGMVNILHEAFSRAQSEKVYVQDLLKLNSEETRDIIREKNGHVYMCGATNMGRSVEKVLEEVLGEDGADYLKKMKDEKRFAKELWSA